MKDIRLVFVWCLLGLGNGVFAQSNPGFEERVDFSIPKTIYFTGEKIWLSIEVAAPSGPTPSRIVYAELWNRYNESAALAKIPLQQGAAFNYLEIPHDLPSDQYLLRVFTRVSPDQDPEKGLVQEFVTVFNPRIPPVVVGEQVQALNPNPVSSAVALSKTSVSPGEEVTVSYTGEDSLLEMTVAVPNPFLFLQGKQSSKTLYEDLPQRRSVPEFFGHIIEARILSGDADSSSSGLYYLSLHGEKSALFTDKLDADGSLFFDAGGLRHWDFMIVQGKENQAMNDFEIVSPSPQTKFKSDFQFPPLQVSPADGPLLRELLKGSQIGGYFVQEFQNDPIPVVTGFVQDRTFLLDDYNRFEDVETHLKEYVPEVLVRSRGKSKEMRVLNSLQGRSFTQNPLILVDAMPVFDTGLLLKFNPGKFERLEVLTRPFYLNEEIYQGVVSFSSFQNDFGGFSLPANAVYVPYPGILPLVTERSELFQLPSRDADIMDWRTVLYWSAALQNPSRDKITSVTAPLAKGVFQVTVKTRDSSGITNYEYARFEVK